VEGSVSLRDTGGADPCGRAIATGSNVATAANRIAENRKIDRLVARFIVAPEFVFRIAQS
jgi:hypothetical protein